MFANGFHSLIIKRKNTDHYLHAWIPNDLWLYRHGEFYRRIDLCRPSFREARNKPFGWEIEEYIDPNVCISNAWRYKTTAHFFFVCSICIRNGKYAYKLQNALKVGATCLNLQLDAVVFQFSNLSKCAYKVEITSIDGTTFMLQFAYCFCSFAIGKCAYKLQIALIDGATFMWQLAYGLCKLCNMQMCLRIT